MDTYTDLARTVIARLRAFCVTIIPRQNGTISFFVPSPGALERPSADCEYVQGMQDGSIRELQYLIRSSPRLKRAVIEEISCHRVEVSEELRYILDDL